MSGIGHRVQDWGFAAGWGLMRRMPDRWARSLFQAGADLAARRSGPDSQLRRNLARVVPRASDAELDELVRGALRSYARYWREVFRLPSMDHQAIYRQVDDVVVNRSMIDEALARGKGLILALPHTANWDVSGIWLVGHSGTFTTVAERLRPESLFQRFVAYRESLGFEILPASGDGSTYRTLIERLRQNRVVCLPADRDLSRRGMPVTFFGEQTRMPAGPARLAAMTGATLLIVDQTFTEDGWGLRMHTPMAVHEREEIPAVTQHMADAFAGDIAANPMDWHMVQPLWISDLPDERQRVLATESGGAA
jgi:phosphatidylinositol dimannoside acyltransferase